MILLYNNIDLQLLMIVKSVKIFPGPPYLLADPQINAEVTYVFDDPQQHRWILSASCFSEMIDELIFT